MYTLLLFSLYFFKNTNAACPFDPPCLLEESCINGICVRPPSPTRPICNRECPPGQRCLNDECVAFPTNAPIPTPRPSRAPTADPTAPVLCNESSQCDQWGYCNNGICARLVCEPDTPTCRYIVNASSKLCVCLPAAYLCHVPGVPSCSSDLDCPSCDACHLGRCSVPNPPTPRSCSYTSVPCQRWQNVSCFASNKTCFTEPCIPGTCQFGSPSPGPTGLPTLTPTLAPTTPQGTPTVATGSPTLIPTGAPTVATGSPTLTPTRAPSVPTGVPTKSPTSAPTVAPTGAPSSIETSSPSRVPTADADIADPGIFSIGILLIVLIPVFMLVACLWTGARRRRLETKLSDEEDAML